MQTFPKVYVAVYLEDKHEMGALTELGNWHNYYVYEVEDHLASRLEFLKTYCIPLPNKEVANAWKFADLARDFLVIRDEALSFYNISKEQTQFHNIGKRRYVMTEEDKKNGLTFAKLILKGELYRKFKNLFEFTKDSNSEIYDSFMSYVYGTDDKKFIEKVEKSYPKIVSNYKQKQKYLEILISEMSKAEDLIDSAKNCIDIRAVAGTLFELYANIPTKLINDKRTISEEKIIS